jgi:hypothetical protein
MGRRPLLALVALLLAWRIEAQQLGTKVMGGLGIDAGTQSPPGLFVVDRFLQFTSHKVRDRNGALLPIPGLDILARANAIGIAYTLAQRGSPYLTVAAGVPFARVVLNSDEPLASVDRFGLGDIFVQPMKAGWRGDRYDVVTAYNFFAPTGRFEPKASASVGRGNWTHQFSLGGAAFADTTRTNRASALATYEVNQFKRGIDIKRGDMLSIQGGAGASVARGWLVGVAGYGLWQTTDDRGADLPPKLIGLRTRSYGVGPEVDLVVPQRGLKFDARYEWDLGVRSRPQGQVLAIGLSYRAWGPTK